MSKNSKAFLCYIGPMRFLLLVIFSLMFSLSSFALSYKLIKPKNLRPNPTLITLLHGCTQTTNAFVGLTHFEKYIEDKNFILLVPAQSVVRNPAKCWNWYAVHTALGRSELQSIKDLVVKYSNEFKVSGSYLYGFSAGSAMGSNLIGLHSELFDGVLLHSGYPFHGKGVMNISDFDLPQEEIYLSAFMGELTADQQKDLKLLRTKLNNISPRLKNIVIVSGQKDLIAAHKFSKASYIQFLDDSSFLTYKAFDGYRVYQAEGKWKTTLYQIPLMGHAWSGGDDNFLFAGSEFVDVTQESFDLFGL